MEGVTCLEPVWARMRAATDQERSAPPCEADPSREKGRYPDRYGIDAWDPENHGQVFVHIVNSAQYRDITGREPPPTPIDVKTYTDHGLPWFELYDEHLGDLPPPEPLTKIPTIEDRDRELGRGMGDAPLGVSDKQVEKLLPREGSGRRTRDLSHPVHTPPRKDGQTQE